MCTCKETVNSMNDLCEECQHEYDVWLLEKIEQEMENRYQMESDALDHMVEVAMSEKESA